MNDEIRLMRSSALEALEDEDFLREVERQGVQAEITPMLRLTGILTVYKGTPMLFLQEYRRVGRAQDEGKKD